MLVAKQKRKENIIEYILYLYQVEDLIRAFQLDINLIETQLIPKYHADEKGLTEITAWYKNLLLMMEREGIQEKGHLQFIKNQIQELNEFHLKLLATEVSKDYVSLYKTVAGLLTELKQKNREAENNIQLSVDTVYGYLLLKMQKKEITGETTDAVRRISGWLNLLSGLFKDYEADELVL